MEEETNREFWENNDRYLRHLAKHYDQCRTLQQVREQTSYMNEIGYIQVELLQDDMSI